MNVDSVISNAFSVAQGKATPPDQGSPKYAQLLQIVDRKQKEWSHESGVQWSSLYQRQTLVSSSTDTFTLDDSVDSLVLDPQDPVLVGTQEFEVVRPNQLYKNRFNYACAKIGQQLVFSRVIDTNLAGQTITIPVSVKVDDITQPTDEIQVDDPAWLYYASAAEFARNDIIKQSQYSNLYDIANSLMQRMKEENAGSYDEVERENFMDVMSWD